MRSRRRPDSGNDLRIYTDFVASMPTILVIDDSPADLLSLKKAFSNAGVSNPLFSVKSHRKAMQYINGEYPYMDRMQHPVPSVILLDLDEPGGFELLTWIRDKLPNGGLLIVALTRLEEVRKISRAYSLGANSFLTKPVNASQLQELISIFSGYWLIQRWPMQERKLVAAETCAYDC
jgi:CheY-like chemotaxis protein